MIFTTEGFVELTVESWSEWDSNNGTNTELHSNEYPTEIVKSYGMFLIKIH